MAVIGYARTSTTDQTAGLDDQVATLTAKGCERIYAEHISASAEKRPELLACLGYLRDGDTLIVTKPDRLARSVTHMLTMAADLQAKGVALRILSMDIDTGTPTGKLTLTILAAVAEWERAIMLERQRAGIAEAQAAGKYLGRKPKLIPDQVRWAINENAKGRDLVEIARMLNVHRGTLWRAMRALGRKKEELA